MSRKPAPTTAEIAVRFVADRLRQLRTERGYTQESLAARAGVSSKFIGQLERGETNVSVAVLWALCVDGLSVPIDQFFAVDASAVDTDVAAVTATVQAQPPALRRLGLRVLRTLYTGLDDVSGAKPRR